MTREVARCRPYCQYVAGMIFVEYVANLACCIDTFSQRTGRVDFLEQYRKRWRTTSHSASTRSNVGRGVVGRRMVHVGRDMAKTQRHHVVLGEKGLEGSQDGRWRRR